MEYLAFLRATLMQDDEYGSVVSHDVLPSVQFNSALAVCSRVIRQLYSSTFHQFPRFSTIFSADHPISDCFKVSSLVVEKCWEQYRAVEYSGIIEQWLRQSWKDTMALAFRSSWTAMAIAKPSCGQRPGYRWLPCSVLQWWVPQRWQKICNAL